MVHPRFFEPIAQKLRADGLLVVDADLLEGPLLQATAEQLSLPATQIARDAEAPKAAALVLLGAFARATGIVSPGALEAGLAEALPSYRQQTLESNRRALLAGHDAVPPGTQPAWATGAA